MASKKLVAAVVGVGPGLGASLAKRFAAGGYSIGLIARKESSLQSVQRELEQNGHTVLSVTADAGDVSSVKNAFDTIRKKFGNEPEVLPSMIKNGKGTILFTGATASLRGSVGFAGIATSKFALRVLAQSMAREFGPQGIHVTHIIIDGQINTPSQVQRQPGKDINSFINSDTIAETYWQLHIQPRTTWTHELDIRPSVEKF
ncbi:unnamed protein product [Rotaria sp. Silwood2]|nr:unnamed protein product [Rotaria sp. Silwood2]